MELILSLFINALAVWVSAQIIPGVATNGASGAVVAALVLAFVNTFIKPIINALALPVNMLTLGLFAFVINALLIMLVGAIVPGFTVNGFLPAVLFSIVLSLVSMVLSAVLPGKASI